MLEEFKVLNFHGTDLRDDDLLVVANALQATPSAESLDLSFNYITNESIDEIMLLLNKHTNIKKLNISSNNLGDEGVQQLFRALSGTCIEILDMESCLVTSQSIEVLSEVVNETNLKSLDLAHNMIESEGMDCFWDALHNNSKLHHLNLYGNTLRNDGVRNLPDVLLSTASLYSFCVLVSYVSDSKIIDAINHAVISNSCIIYAEYPNRSYDVKSVLAKRHEDLKEVIECLNQDIKLDERLVEISQNKDLIRYFARSEDIECRAIGL